MARQGQILGAATALGLNHATVARRLSGLEAALGVKLVQRLTTGTVLTAEGERFLVHAEAMEQAGLAAAETVAAGGSVEGTVRIGAPDGFGVAFLAPRLGELAARHPGLRLELVPVPRAFSLSRREADIAVTLERPREGRLVARKLTDYALGLYAARDYLDRHGTPQTLADLSRHRLVGYVEDLIYTASLDYTRLPQGLAVGHRGVSAMGQTEAVQAGAASAFSTPSWHAAGRGWCRCCPNIASPRLLDGDARGPAGPEARWRGGRVPGRDRGAGAGELPLTAGQAKSTQTPP